MNHFIYHAEQLAALERRLQELAEEQGVLAVDTEFMREKTYRARLCLLQFGIGEDQYCIDVLSLGTEKILTNTLADTRVTKVLHSAKQDMEVLWQTFQVLPNPVFDTQLAAAFCGADLQMGHSGLVMKKLGIELAQSQARTDWTRRPLSAKQLAYAAEDVAYLAELRSILLAELCVSEKLLWFEQELQNLQKIENYHTPTHLAYQRMSGGGLNLQQQYTLKALCNWREAVAQQRDIPRSWVIRDDRLYELASKQPVNAQEILDLSVFGRKSAARLAPKAAQIIADVAVGEEPIWQRVEPLSKAQKALTRTMMSQVREIAEQHQVAVGLLATRKDVEQLCRSGDSKKLLRGWRKAVIGEPLLANLDGQQ